MSGLVTDGWPTPIAFKPGDTFTIQGVFRRRTDLLSRLLSLVGIVRYTDELEQFVVGEDREDYSSHEEEEA